MSVVVWARAGHRESEQALAFMAQHGFGTDALMDIDDTPPQGPQWDRLRAALGGSLVPLAKQPEYAPDEARMPAWFVEDTTRLRAPVLWTRRGAVAGFREAAWSDCLGLEARPGHL